MPTLTLNATNEQLTRVQTALGLSNGAEVKQWIIDKIKSEVKNAELQKVSAVENEKVNTAISARESALNAKASEEEVTLT